jgi:hypothetical protein
MRLRKTPVAWDPKLVRVEYLHDEGNPYYCCFEPRAEPEPAAAADAATPRRRRGFGCLAWGFLVTAGFVLAAVAAALAAR